MSELYDMIIKPCDANQFHAKSKAFTVKHAQSSVLSVLSIFLVILIYKFSRNVSITKR